MSNDKKEFVMTAKTTMQTETMMPSIPVESGGEFILPDYMPKVQKVLRLEAYATPPSKYIGASEAQMSGSVLHTLIYLGEDGETGATVLPSKYEFSVPLDTSDISPAVVVAVDVDSVNYRLNGPRKLTVRTRLRAKPTVFCGNDISDMNSMPDEVHKLHGEIDSVNTRVAVHNDITVSDAIQINKNKESHLIWCGSTAAVSDVKAMEGGVSVRGDVVAKIILSADGKPEVYSKKIPFEEFIDVDIDKGASALCIARVISTEAAKNSDGEVMADVIIALEAITDMPCTVPVLKDAFSENGEDVAKYREITSLKHVMSRSGVYSVSGTVASSGALEVLDTSGKALLDEINVSSGKIVASGRCLLNSICKNNDGTVIANDFSVPFKIDMDCGAEEASVFGNASLANVYARVNGENIEFDMDIALCARAVKPEKIKVLSSFESGSEKNRQANKYPLAVIYNNGESLWSLAKKYRVDPMKMAEMNMLDMSNCTLDDTDKVNNVRSLIVELK